MKAKIKGTEMIHARIKLEGDDDSDKVNAMTMQKGCNVYKR